MNMFNMDAKALHKARIYLAVILLQFGFAGFAIVAQFALNSGTSHYTFAVYRNAIAAVVFAPFALIFERKIRPKMTFNIFLRIIVLGLLDPVMGQNLFYAGMNQTTATFTSAMSNVLPALTFIMAWVLRVEKVNVRKLSSQAKILGTIATVSGAMIMTLVAGPILGLPWTHPESNSPPAPGSSSTTAQNPARGALMIAAGNFGYALFYILQSVTLKSYPAGLSLTSMICASGALQGTVLTFIVERGNLGIWAIGLNSELLAYAYGGIISSGVTYYVSGYIMKEKGPVFVTAFNPLNMIIVAILSSFIFAEQLVVGQIIGALVIVVGLYLVIWGTIKDQRANNVGHELPLQQRDQLDVNPTIKDDVQAIADVEVLQKVSGDNRLLKRSFSVNVGMMTSSAKKTGDNLTTV